MKDCPERPKDNNEMGKKTMLNKVDVIPSLQTFETKIEVENVPMRVVTRAQAKDAGREDERIRESPRRTRDVKLEKS